MGYRAGLNRGRLQSSQPNGVWRYRTNEYRQALDYAYGMEYIIIRLHGFGPIVS